MSGLGTSCFHGDWAVNTINHIGLTLATAMTAEFIIRQRITSSSGKKHRKALAMAGAPAHLANRLNGGIYFDFRLVIVGSIVPDILDKPLGFFLAPDLVNSNLRTIGHGGLFALAFVLAGLTIPLEGTAPSSDSAPAPRSDPASAPAPGPAPEEVAPPEPTPAAGGHRERRRPQRRPIGRAGAFVV